jgi:serine/threonine protein kinase
VRVRADCPPAERLADFVEGALPDDVRSDLELHIDVCDACRMGLSALVAGSAPAWTLGRYRIDGVLGAGGMGVVYRGWDPSLARAVAVKVVRPGDDDAALRARLAREAQSLAKLSHPNVCHVYDVGADGDELWIAMELIDGVTLRAWLAGRPSQRTVLAILDGAGRGIAAAHAVGLVHRDVKPENILVDKTGRAVVTDFGLARAADGSHASRTMLAGTPPYLAAELLDGARADARSDQYAFAVTAHEALTGARPKPRGVASSELSPAIRAALERALSDEPDARFPSMLALLDALAPAPERPRRSWRTAVVAGVAACGAAAATFAMTRRGDDESAKSHASQASAGVVATASPNAANGASPPTSTRSDGSNAFGGAPPPPASMNSDGSNAPGGGSIILGSTGSGSLAGSANAANGASNAPATTGSTSSSGKSGTSPSTTVIGSTSQPSRSAAPTSSGTRVSTTASPGTSPTTSGARVSTTTPPGTSPTTSGPRVSTTTSPGSSPTTSSSTPNAPPKQVRQQPASPSTTTSPMPTSPNATPPPTTQTTATSPHDRPGVYENGKWLPRLGAMSHGSEPRASNLAGAEEVMASYCNVVEDARSSSARLTLDWGRVLRGPTDVIGIRNNSQIGARLYEIQGQRQRYVINANIGSAVYGRVDAKVGDLVALCPEDHVEDGVEWPGEWRGVAPRWIKIAVRVGGAPDLGHLQALTSGAIGGAAYDREWKHPARVLTYTRSHAVGGGGRIYMSGYELEVDGVALPDDYRGWIAVEFVRFDHRGDKPVTVVKLVELRPHIFAAPK